MQEEIKLIKDTNKYFISNLGYCFKVQGKREIEIPIKIIRGVPKVHIQDKKLNLVYLLIDYFLDINILNSKISHKIVNGRIPIKSIKYRELPKNSTKDEKIIFNYKCKEKAHNNNRRVNYEQILTEIDILNTLKRCNFNCFYCGEIISPKKWHLDHVVPLYLGGVNTFNNIASSCKQCNLMKGYFGMESFLNKCNKITKYNKSL